MRHGLRIVAIGALLLSTAVCHDSTDPGPVYCVAGAAVSLPAIQLTVLDAETGNVIASGVTATVHSGLGTETAWQSPMGFLYGNASAGTVSVTVQVAGYQDWSRGNLVLKAGSCGPLPLYLAAWMIK